MNRKTISLAAIAMLLATAAFAQSVTFGSTSVNAGDTWVDTSSYATSASFSLNDGFRDLDPQSHSTSVVRTKNLKVISATGNDRITEAEVDYPSVLLDGTDVSATFANKKYRVTVRGNHVDDVTYDDGTAPPDAEAEFVRGDNVRLGQARAMNKTFGGKTVSVGERLRSNNEEDLIDAEAGMVVRDFSMTLASISGEGESQTATFDVVLQLSSSAKKRKNAPPDETDPFDTSSVTMDLAGTLTTKVTTARITNISLSGPSVIGAEKKTAGKKGRGGTEDRYITVSGTGSATLSQSYSYP